MLWIDQEVQPSPFIHGLHYWFMLFGCLNVQWSRTSFSGYGYISKHFDKEIHRPAIFRFLLPYWWSKEKCTYNWSIGVVSWGVCGGHGGSTLLWVPWWLATHGRYKKHSKQMWPWWFTTHGRHKKNAVNKCYHGDLCSCITQRWPNKNSCYFTNKWCF